METILLSVADGIARLTLNRPEKLNCFNIQMHQEFTAALDEIERDDKVRLLLLTGAGRGFCAGQDLSSRRAQVGVELDLGASLENYYNPLIRRLTALPLPFVCAVNGVAAGSGANIALAADIVIAARNAKFIQSFTNIGLIPDAGGTWTLPRLVGQARALGLVLTGLAVEADQAQAWGMIWKSVDDASFAAEVDKLTERLANAPTRALVATKRAIRASWGASLDDQLNVERDLQRMLGRTDDYREGIDAFLEKRSPKFSGR